MQENVYDIIIIGSGPAGLTAGIYTARAALKVLILGGVKWGGQLMQTTEVENFPGFPDGIMGPELMARMRKQAERMGVKVVEEDVTNIEVNEKPFKVSTSPNITPSDPPLNLSGGGSGVYFGKAVIVATGAAFNWLCLPNEQRLIGRGVSSCATCDAAFFKNKKVAVVGGGDAAMEEALVLSKFASEVILIHRRDSFRASKVMQQKVFENPKIKIVWNSTVEDILGENKVEGIKIKSQILNPPAGRAGSKFQINSNFLNSKMVGQTETEVIWEMAVDGVFVAIGHNPATELFKGKLELDEKGYIKRSTQYSAHSAQGYKNMTSVEGIFTAGDVHDIAYKQAITAAGYGCQAALEAERWLSENVG